MVNLDSFSRPILFLCLIVAGIVLLNLHPEPLRAEASLSVGFEKETVSDQAMSDSQNLLVFKEKITNTGDSDATINSFSFEFNDGGSLDAPENSIDTILVSVAGSSARIDVGPSMTGPTYTTPGNLGVPVAANNGQVNYEVRLLSLENPKHDDQFNLSFTNVQYTEAGSGTVKNEVDHGVSDNITIKSLIESYSAVESIPRVLASESKDIPILHLEYAGANDDENRDLFFDTMALRVRELVGDVIPGGSPSDAYGDFSAVKLIRSDQEEFGEGTQETLFTIGRTEMPDTTSANTGDSFVIDFSLDQNITDGDDAWPPDADGGGFVDERFTETTSKSHYYVTIATNQGWGTSPLDAPNAQFFGYGDQWDAWVDTGAIGLSNGVTNDTRVNVTQGPMIHSVAGLIGSKGVLVDKLDGQPKILQNDRVGLDQFPNPVFRFLALGASGQGSQETSLDSIRLHFPKTSADFTPRTDLKALTQDKNSGLSIWYNESAFSTLGHGQDRLLPISPDNSSWLSDTMVRLELQNGFELPSPSEQISGPDPDMEVDRGVTLSNANFTFYVNSLMKQTKNHPDSFVARVPLGGIQFSQGVSVTDPDSNTFSPELNPRPAPGVLGVQNHTDTSSHRAQSVTVFFDQLTSDNQEIGAPSDPTPVIGLNAWDHADQGGTQAVIDRIDINFEEGGDSFTASDLNPLANTDTSGVSIWADNNNSGQQGVFEPDIDQRLDLDNIGNPGGSQKDAPTGDGEDVPHVRLKIDHSGPEGSIPKDDSGGTRAGNDLFIVVNTSDNADNLDQFKAALGNPAINDGALYEIKFTDENDVTSEVANIFADGDGSATQRFFSDLVQINTITALTINDLPGPNAKISSSGERVGLFGLNLSDGANGDQTLDRITTTFRFSSTGPDVSDIRALSEDESSGVSLYKDNGDGAFDPESDQFIPLINPNWQTFSETATVNLTPDTTLQVPDSNDGLDDFFVAVRASEDIQIGDTIAASILGGDIRFSVEDSPEDKSATTRDITASLPILINDLTSSPFQKFTADNSPLAVLGINASDGGSFNEFLEKVTVELLDVNANDFSINDLNDLTTDGSSGVSIWKDSNNNGSFETGSDQLLTPDNTPTFSNDKITFDFTNNTSDDTSIPNVLDNSNDFFVVLRTSEPIPHGHDFTAGITSEGVETTLFKSGGAKESNTIVFGSANVAQPDFSDTDLMNDALDATVQVSNQDTVSLRIATGQGLNSLPPAQFELVGSRKPDQPGGSFFTFNDVDVSVTSETVALVARGFNDTGPTDFSDKEFFFRTEIAGISLEGRSNTDLADALAADEDFGIVVFGRRGGSNDNPSDPAFDPSNGETLKIIPPTNETATMRVFNLEQQMVFKTSTSVPGQPIEWDGSGFEVPVVNNGPYIVRVKSGSKEKTFPVMIVK